ncbi:hypothetical protein J3U11_06815 [Gilliamella sp. B2840]|uniref:hypothetical protein n=1 Tax=unclassified Gilliamella TaxID=2685620 RepID=UPI00226A97A3|nr:MULTISPECIES: hypothetical protein [unclassified Gilliamella]MCX8665103.1 hypothetical protein [Gilliamella sp. B2887]MCX8697080.1 hypothetical protein [Gilliamella sp. B2828]MCX8699049.1 hypothetical protein [Gilliamella sp. B3000]MCX8700778.1 hypothetical protein [Gilliamella sp. B2840]
MKILIITNKISNERSLTLKNALNNALNHESTLIADNDNSLTVDYAKQFDCVISTLQNANTIILKSILDAEVPLVVGNDLLYNTNSSHLILGMTTTGGSVILKKEHQYLKPAADHFIFNSASILSRMENIPVFYGSSLGDESSSIKISTLCSSAVVLGANANVKDGYADTVFFKKGGADALGGTFKANCMWFGWLSTVGYTAAGLNLLNSILYFINNKTKILNGSVQSSEGNGLSRDVYFYQKPTMTAYKTRSDNLGQFSIELPSGHEYVGISFDEGDKNAVVNDKIII